MGYTHYFEQIESPTDPQWDALVTDFKRLYAASMVTTPLPIQREDDISAPPRADDDAIIFNGIGGDGHETFYFSRGSRGFNFCKTAAKPYDLAVTATLILVHHHMPHCYNIRSDGIRADWLDARELVKTLLDLSVEIPPSIRG